MQSAQPEVTVALPVFNGAQLLAKAIESATSQRAGNIAVHVFDNASTDGSLAVARRLLPPEAVHTADQNLGATWNFNRAFTQTKGEFFAWLAADDRLLPGFVEVALAELERFPDRACCLPGIQFTDSEGSPTRTQTDLSLASPDPRVRLRSFLRRRRWTETYCLYRRSALEASPLFEQAYGNDVLLSWWFLLRGPYAVTPEVLLEYREYPAKTVEQTSLALDPGAAPVQWRKVHMWRRLYAMTRAVDVEPDVARTARRELALVLSHPGTAFHVAEDVLARWPGLDRVVRRAWASVGSPGRLSPER